jgi:hypothetical protein
LELTFSGKVAGTVRLFATRPGETVRDTGIYTIGNGRITIHFKEVDWAADDQAFEFDGCTLTLPFKAVSATSGPGTSAWQRQDPKCAAPNPATAKGEVPKTLAPFSADEVITECGQTQKVRIFVAGNAFRAESQARGRPSVTIIRSDRNAMWVIDPQARTYTETALSVASGALFQPGSIPSGCTVVSDEQIGAYHCQKQVCHISAGGKDYVETRWAAKELGGLVIRYSDGVETLEIQNLKPGPQDPALFEIPAGYQRRTP